MKRLIQAMNRYMTVDDVQQAYPDMSYDICKIIWNAGKNNDEVYSLCDYVFKYVNGPKDKNFIYEAVPYALDNLSESQIKVFLQAQANRKEKPRSGAACFDWINKFKDFNFDSISDDMLTLLFRTNFLYQLVNGINKDIRESDNLGETFYGDAKACNLVMDVANRYYGGTVEPESKDAYNLLTLCNIYFKTHDFKATDVMYNVIEETGNINISKSLRNVMRNYLLDGGDPEKVELAIKNCNKLKDSVTRTLVKNYNKDKKYEKKTVDDIMLDDVYERIRNGEDVDTAVERMLYDLMASKRNRKIVKAENSPTLYLNSLSKAVNELQVCNDFDKLKEYFDDVENPDNHALDLLDEISSKFDDVLKAITDVKEYIKKK